MDPSVEYGIKNKNIKVAGIRMLRWSWIGYGLNGYNRTFKCNATATGKMWVKIDWNGLNSDSVMEMCEIRVAEEIRGGQITSGRKLLGKTRERVFLIGNTVMWRRKIRVADPHLHGINGKIWLYVWNQNRVKGLKPKPVYRPVTGSNLQS